MKPTTFTLAVLFVVVAIGCTGQGDPEPQLDASSDTYPADATPDSMETQSPDTDVSNRGCDNNTQVGWTAELSTKQHDVSGTAVIRDDSTIEIQNFTFDGEGPAVFPYIASCSEADQGSWGDGQSLGSQLDAAYDGETLTLQIPDDVDVAEIGGISIWCVEFSVDFGSGLFTSPN